MGIIILANFRPHMEEGRPSLEVGNIEFVPDMNLRTHFPIKKKTLGETIFYFYEQNKFIF